MTMKRSKMINMNNYLKKKGINRLKLRWWN